MELPIYLPKKNYGTSKMYLAIWNCGTRPQTFWNMLKAIRITIRKNNKPLITIKKGEY